jgi:hypothetical protein
MRPKNIGSDRHRSVRQDRLRALQQRERSWPWLLAALALILAALWLASCGDGPTAPTKVPAKPPCTTGALVICVPGFTVCLPTCQ